MMHLQVVIPERELFDGEVEAIQLPGAEGQLGILPGHAAVITLLAEGELHAMRGDEVYRFAIHGGFAQIEGDRVIVLADSAEQAEGIDLHRAEVAWERAVEALRHHNLPPAERQARTEHLKRAETRLRIARHRTPSGPPKFSGGTN